MKITLKKYDSAWPQQFEKEKQEVQDILSAFSPVIEHIGSTSIPGLAAKPVIDILIGISSPGDLDDAIQHFDLPGYKYIQKHEDIMPFRRFIVKGAFDEVNLPWKIGRETALPADFRYMITHHIHMVETSSDFFEDHILFRDYLRLNDDARIAYELLKTYLSEKEWNDGNDYAAAKTNFVRSVLDKAKHECEVAVE